jgi:hypothetical protein
MMAGSGIIFCPKCSNQTAIEKTLTKPNFDVLDQIHGLEVKCDGCVRPSENVCLSCMQFSCEISEHHECPDPDLVDHSRLNLSQLLQERIGQEKLSNLEDPRNTFNATRSNAELVIILRNEENGGPSMVKCQSHPNLPGEYLDISTFTILCKNCNAKARGTPSGNEEPSSPSFLPLGSGEEALAATEFVRGRLAERLSECASFNIPPVFLKHLKSDSLSKLAMILKHLDISEVFVPHCPLCLVKLTNATALRFPCAKVHLICKACRLKEDSSTMRCCYDDSEHPKDALRSVALETFYAKLPTCPLCMHSNELKVIQCEHSFCDRCTEKLKKCPICSTPCNLPRADVLSEPFLAYFSKLQCTNCSRPATKISKQTCQLFCLSCASAAAKLHSFEGVPDRLCEYFDRRIGQYLEVVTGRPDTRALSKIVELRDIIYTLPTASHELKRLLRMHPAITLQDQANLLYYLKTDLTDCDMDNLEESVGWRIPQVTRPGYKVVMRFSDVLPPQFRQEGDERKTRCQWGVKLQEDQIEIVGFAAFAPVRLHGVVMATSIGPSAGVLQYFQVFDAQYLEDGMLYSLDCQQLFSHQRNDALSGPENHKVIMFERPFELLEGTSYIFKFKLGGSDSFRRGNLYTLTEEASIIGPDDVIFLFHYALCMTGEKINGQNDLTGPLLGLVYN